MDSRGTAHVPPAGAYAAYVLLATTGMRRGEALGLRWSDLDLDTSRASVRQTVITVKHRVEFGTPKTAKGRRTVALDAGTVDPRVVQERLEHATISITLDIYSHVAGTLDAEAAEPVAGELFG